LTVLLGILSEIERAIIKERTKAGLERAREEGKRIGRPPYPFRENEVKFFLDRGYRIKDNWKILKADGKICNEKGKCMSYETFRRKVKKLLGNKKPP